MAASSQVPPRDASPDQASLANGRWRGPAAEALGEEEKRRSGEDDWMLTYTDVLTLLITLFVLMLSYATFSDPRYEELVRALRQGVSGAVVAPSAPAADDEAMAAPDAMEREDPRRGLIEALRLGLKEQNLGDLVSLRIEKENLVLEINESVLFDVGRADLKAPGAAFLERLAPTLSGGRFRISVEGHTDSVPIATRRFPSNWELSAARASTVVRRLIGLGIAPERLRAIGYADTRPVADNESAEGRARNRRVDLLLEVAGE